MENAQYLKTDVEILNEKIRFEVNNFIHKYPEFQPIVEVIYEEEYVDTSDGRQALIKTKPIIKTRLKLKGHE